MRSALLPIFVVVACLGDSSPGTAETVLLKNGGQLTGQIERSPRDDGTPAGATYVIRVQDGILLRIAADQVGRVVEPTPDERQYAELLAHMPATADGHATLAAWCHDHQLGQQRDFHWQQVLEQNPDHADARRALGFSRVRGQWLRPDDKMRAQGYVKENGVWRLPQQRIVQDRQKQIELATKELRRNLRTWRGWLGGRRHDEAIQRIRTIDDPLAATGLHDLLLAEKDVDIRFLYLEALARLRTPMSVDALIDAAINDDELEIRLKAVEYLREYGRSRAASGFIPQLGHASNRVVNRAAVALGRLGDPEAVLPLINALVTRHESVVTPAGGNIRPSFGAGANAGGIGLSAGGGPKRISQDVNNKGVLEALIALTGKNYQYSIPEWKDWYVSTRSLPDDINLRRDR